MKISLFPNVYQQFVIFLLCIVCYFGDFLLENKRVFFFNLYVIFLKVKNVISPFATYS